MSARRHAALGLARLTDEQYRDVLARFTEVFGTERSARAAIGAARQAIDRGTKTLLSVNYARIVADPTAAFGRSISELANLGEVRA